MSVSKSILFILFVYLIILYSNFSALILLVLMVLLYDMFMKDNSKRNIEKAYLIDYISSCPEPPKLNLPKWISFPEYEQARFINHITSVLWNPHMKSSIEEKIRRKLEWKMEIQKAKYKKLSQLELSKLDLGSSPPLISSIKTCEINCLLCAKHIPHDQSKCNQKHCALEIAFVFHSNDVKSVLTVGYKNIRAHVELSNIRLSGIILLKLCDFVNVFPGFSKYTVSFYTFPDFDFKLTFQSGSFKLNYIPKVSKIIEPFLKKTVWSSLIFPRAMRFHIKKNAINTLRKRGELIKYGQKSNETEGSLFVDVKDITWDSTVSQEADNGTPLMLSNGHLYYKDDLGYSWHFVASIKGTEMIHKSKSLRSNYVTKKIIWNEEVLFKNLDVTESRISTGPVLDIDVRFGGKKWDEILGQCSINLRWLLNKNGFTVRDYFVEIVRLFNGTEVKWKKVATMRMDIIYMPPNVITSKKELNEKGLFHVMSNSIRTQYHRTISTNLKPFNRYSADEPTIKGGKKNKKSKRRQSD